MIEKPPDPPDQPPSPPPPSSPLPKPPADSSSPTPYAPKTLPKSPLPPFNSSLKNQDLLENTIYFENFPEFHNETEFKSLLKSLLPFKEIRIIQNKNRAGKKFGFIKCDQEMNVQSAINILNGIWIGKLKINANKAKFNMISKRGVDPSQIRTSRNPEKPNIISKTTFTARSKDIRSYADVIKGNRSTHMEKISMIYDTKGETPSWLERSCLGVLRSLESIPSIHQIVSSHYPGSEVRVLGGNLIIVTFPHSDLKSRSFNDENVEWTAKFFELWRDWDKHDVAQGRFAWLKILRVPLHVWKSDFFKSLVSGYGDFIVESKETESRSRFDIAKILVNTNRSERIQDQIKVQIDGEIYDISIIEDGIQELLFPIEGGELSGESSPEKVAPEIPLLPFVSPPGHGHPEETLPSKISVSSDVKSPSCRPPLSRSVPIYNHLSRDSSSAAAPSKSHQSLSVSNLPAGTPPSPPPSMVAASPLSSARCCSPSSLASKSQPVIGNLVPPNLAGSGDFSSSHLSAANHAGPTFKSGAEIHDRKIESKVVNPAAIFAIPGANHAAFKGDFNSMSARLLSHPIRILSRIKSCPNLNIKSPSQFMNGPCPIQSPSESSHVSLINESPGLISKPPIDDVVTPEVGKASCSLRLNLRDAKKKARQKSILVFKKSQKIKKISSSGSLLSPESISPLLSESVSDSGIIAGNIRFSSTHKEVVIDSRSEADDILQLELQLGLDLNGSWDEAMEEAHNLVLEDNRNLLTP